MIRLESVSKQIKGKIILDDITLQLDKGKSYLIKGHNGSGKTMLLRMLSGLISPTEGIIEKPDADYGIIIENPSFIESETALYNLEFLASIRKKIGKEDIEKSLKLVNLHDKGKEKVRRFSLGMKQRLAICQAIMEDPEILLLDEPFNALDEENLQIVTDYLNKIKKDKVIVVASHGFDNNIGLFDEVIHMNNGKIVSIEKTCL